ncbi:MAG: hypothetical protein ACLQVG_02845, partial [Terriglobia bacterium]
MKTLFQAAALGFLMAVCLTPDAGSSGPKGTKKADDVLLSTMERELQRAREQLGKLVCCNIQFLTMVAGHCLVVGVRLAVPSWLGRAIKMQRVRQAVPLQPGRQRR